MSCLYRTKGLCSPCCGCTHGVNTTLCLFSSNGTFVGGERIGEWAEWLGEGEGWWEGCVLRVRGWEMQCSACVATFLTSGKNKTRVLNSDDEIALSLKKNKGDAWSSLALLSGGVCSLPPTQRLFSMTEGPLKLRPSGCPRCVCVTSADSV